ncbi:cytochrome P450 [Kutzneria kofuensis]|uniref:Pentalenolactone synthase n=1 Tax=Kutzneria kofuensis TaxID=103725 RepID=A0A7W9NK61_9PSEU|nr:cytochrome P450 [Kutzneria kofuensis]MBB5895374.1 pentalenolactone synthase [Kutzneria kofuensis]
MTVTESRPQLPFKRANAIDIAPLYGVLHRETAPVEVLTPAGDPAWLITRFEQARQIFADPRFGRSHPAPEQASKISDAAILNGPSGEYEQEQANHSRLRRLLVPAFSAGRMRKLSDHVQELVDARVDEMIAVHDADPDKPVDLHALLSFALPVLVICELLGVPYEDREYFHELSVRIGRMDIGAEAQAASDELREYMRRLAADKRAEPQADVVTDLVKAQAEDPTFSEEDMARLAAGLLFAGHETTMTRIDMGVVFLLADLSRRDRFAADPEGQAQATVEEVLRMTASGDLGLLRYAREDVDVEGVTIKRGDCVLLSANAANRDPSVFADPNEFDPTRTPNIHLAFGHGAHFCIGASLARTELRIALSTLFRRLPGLRLAVDPADLEIRPGSIAGGLVSLPVTW